MIKKRQARQTGGDVHSCCWTRMSRYGPFDSPRLSGTVRDLIADEANEVHVSVVSLWEIAIKRALLREDAPPVASRAALDNFRAANFSLLELTPDHAAAVETLPWHHNDPFDRFLVTQALVEPLRLLTHDAKLSAYDASIILF